MFIFTKKGWRTEGFYRPYRASIIFRAFPGLCPGLSSFAPLGWVVLRCKWPTELEIRPRRSGALQRLESVRLEVL